MDTFPDLGALSDLELKDMIQQLTDILSGKAIPDDDEDLDRSSPDHRSGSGPPAEAG